MIVLLPNRREIDTMRALKERGLSLSTVSCKRRMLNVARPVPVLTKVVRLNPRNPQLFEQLLADQGELHGTER